MISPEHVQKAIIAKLKTNLPLVNALGGADKIKEIGYQGMDFTYPAIRVDINSQTPIGNGTDHVRLSTFDWSIKIYSEKDSSYEANNLMGLVMNALFNVQILDATDNNNIPHFNIIRIDVITTNNAMRINERLWAAEIFFESQMNIQTPP